MASRSSAEMTLAGEQDLWFLPLGGCGEIGMNLNLYGHAGRWLMVDCGVTFYNPLQPQTQPPQHTAEVQAADPSFIAAQRENLCGIVITHAHEDHIGALPYLWPRLQAPVYCTPFAAEVLRRKLVRTDLVEQIPIIEIPPGGTCQIGPFLVNWLNITHSIPECQALLISTPAGKVFHTADWKMDPAPMLGRPFKPQVFKRLAAQGITAMVCDSTNALKSGFSLSETACFHALREVVSQAPKRVLVTGFSSNIGRLISLGRIAQQTGRYLALFGRAMENMVGAARACGYWPDDLPLIDNAHIGFLPAEEVLVAATGSQGEPRAALNKLAEDRHPQLLLAKDDLVIFSANLIPGNEMLVSRLVDKLKAKQLQVLQAADTLLPIHVSGHPNQGELAEMYQAVKPAVAIPVHGEAAHMQANAAIAREVGVPQQLLGQNGDLFVLAPKPRIWPGFVKAGRVPIVNT
ncbi:ribonuclease J [Alishewanella sp. HH-ZS]|uniref:ribonuclease J n=1 Tax=Alishewanella sp. HH-ZS TaxID=1856684 RepID=UPI000823684F|nr:ribonuclease J [Alishewanella sp. HH-ZS]OCW92884.1 MBL fold metallo-hydrolase [Alishewanella sp. HH-ZS]